MIEIKKNEYARVKKWREENREKFQAQWLRFYQKNAERLKANKRAKYAKSKLK